MSGPQEGAGGMLERIEAVASAFDPAGLADSEALHAAREELLGKKSFMVLAKACLKDLEPSERRTVGRALNELRERIDAALQERAAAIGESATEKALVAERMDLTELMVGSVHAGHLNLVSQSRDELEDVFVAMGFTVAEGPEAETDWYNFEALNIPPDHPARSMWDTLFLDVSGTLGETGGRLGRLSVDVAESPFLMRTHTSPVQIHLLQELGPPIYAVMPGRTYRRETPDARHLATFHQIEGLVVDRGITFGHLAGTIEAFTTSYFGPNIHSRLRPSYFPFTEPSAEFEITCTICAGAGCRTCSQTGWIELGGCGMVDPAVFEAVGIDPEEWSGFAFGFGIDRCPQMRHSISDLRVLIANDLRFLRQF